MRLLLLLLTALVAHSQEINLRGNVSALPSPAAPALYVFTSSGPRPVEIGVGLKLENVGGAYRLALDSAVFSSSVGFRPNAPHIPKDRAVELALSGLIPARGWCEGERCMINLCGSRFFRVPVADRQRALSLPPPNRRDDGSISTLCR